METTRLIKTLVVAEVMLSLIYLGSYDFLSEFYECVEYTVAGEIDEDSPWQLRFQQFIIDLFSWSLVIAYIVAVTGILSSNSWAGQFFIGVTVCDLLLSPFTGAVFQHALQDTIATVVVMLDAFIIALLVFTPSVFRNKKIEEWYDIIESKFTAESP